MRPTEAHISKRVLTENVKALGRTLSTPFWAVVKADAYGHGALETAKSIEGSNEIIGFAVSLVEEGVELRDGGIKSPILVMGPSMVGAHQEVVDYGLLPMVSSKEDVQKFAAIGKKTSRAIEMHLKFDTGMGRLGLDPSDSTFINACFENEALDVSGVSSHFACADDDDAFDDKSFTKLQIQRFEELISTVEKQTPRKLAKHICNSSGAAKFSQARYNQSRIGLALYGGGCGAQFAHTQQPLTLKSHVTQMRTITKGDSIGYERWFVAPRGTKVAVLPIGYADGYPKQMGRSAKVLIHGQKVPVLGAVSMDMVVLDVTDVKQAVNVGDEVVLLGPQHNELISLADFSSWSRQSEYEAICGISKRVPRKTI